MIEIIRTVDNTSTIKYSWTIESFNEQTGNMCQKFTKNYHQAIDFYPEVRKNG